MKKERNGDSVPTTVQQQLDEVQKMLDEKDYEISRLNKLIEDNSEKHKEECIIYILFNYFILNSEIKRRRNRKRIK